MESIQVRLKRLEAMHGGKGVILVSIAGTEWSAVSNNHVWNFPTLEAAEKQLSRVADVLIIDDL